MRMKKKRQGYKIHKVFIASKARPGWINLGGNVLHVVAIKGETPYHEVPYQSGALFWLPPYLNDRQLKGLYQDVMSEIKVAPADRPKSLKAMKEHLEWERGRYFQLSREGATNIQETVQREDSERMATLNKTIFKPVSVEKSKELARRKRLAISHPKHHKMRRRQFNNMAVWQSIYEQRGKHDTKRSLYEWYDMEWNHMQSEASSKLDKRTVWWLFKHKPAKNSLPIKLPIRK